MNAMRLLTFACSTALCVGASFGQDEAAASLPEGFQLIKLEHVPAADVAASLAQLMRGSDNLKIVPQPLSNSLLIVAPDQELGPLRDLVRLLDARPAAIDLDVTILQTAVTDDAEAQAVELSGESEVVMKNIAALEKAGTVRVLERLHLTTLDNQRAKLEVGKTEAVTRGRTFGGPPTREGFGRASQAIMSMESVGTTLTGSGRVSGNDVLLELAVEKMWIPETEPASDGEAASTDGEKEKMSVLSTVRVAKGQAIHLGGQTFRNKHERSRISVVVTAKVTP